MEGQMAVIPVERIERAILSIRGEKVMLDNDLAELYGVETKALNQAVKRNADRFPEDFMFQLSAGEVFKLNRSQIVTGSQKHRDPRFPPYAYTEHGALMLANRPPFSPRRGQSARGLAHSETLRAFRKSSCNAPASWTAVALHRFHSATARGCVADRPQQWRKTGRLKYVCDRRHDNVLRLIPRPQGSFPENRCVKTL